MFAGPHHPYTEALLSAVPTLDGQRPDRIKLQGEIPSAANPPSGCVFHTRCPRRLSTGICESTEPPLLEVEPGHLMRCHIPIDELRHSATQKSIPPRSQGGSAVTTERSITAGLGRLREGQGEIGNHVIDEFAAGRMSRRDFIRRGTVVGISLPVLGADPRRLRQQLGEPGAAGPAAAAAAGKPGATIKAGIITPTAAINPVTVADQGGLDMLGQTGEYLCLSDQTLKLKPVLAESWTPNTKADVWTFKIRQGVKFHNGAAADRRRRGVHLQAADQPQGSSNALSAFGGVLIPAGVKKVDDFTVAFHLEAPNGNFPYLVSSDNYNVIILPNDYDPAKWESTFIGTGPFVLGLHAEAGRHVHPQREVLGHQGAAAAPSSPSTTPRRRWSWR